MPTIKHLCFFFDGTGHGPMSPFESNVYKACRLLAPNNGEDGNEKQIVFYSEGPGVGELRWTKRQRNQENSIDYLFKLASWNLAQFPPTRQIALGSKPKIADMVLGDQIFTRLVDAYEFLVWNYDPDDRIYIFGYSRGAFAARAFANLLRYIGIVSRTHLDQLPSALEKYLELLLNNNGLTVFSNIDNDDISYFRTAYCDTFVSGRAVDLREENGALAYEDFRALHRDQRQRLSIRYLGLWDTVAAVRGKTYAFASNNSISKFVESCRHALAFDESRSFLFPKPIDNLGALIRISGAAQSKWSLSPDLRYQQQWFPGDHGSVGGGDARSRNLANISLLWILLGAQSAGLALEEGVYLDHLLAEAGWTAGEPAHILASEKRKPRADSVTFRSLTGGNTIGYSSSLFGQIENSRMYADRKLSRTISSAYDKWKGLRPTSGQKFTLAQWSNCLD